MQVPNAAAIDPGTDDQWFETERWFQAFDARDASHSAAARHASGSHAPSGWLLDLLDATWTGDGVDCVDATGTLVITDPAAPDGPTLIAVRTDALHNALHHRTAQITITTRTSDQRHPREAYDGRSH